MSSPVVTHRAHATEFDADINGSPKAVFKLGTVGTGQHANPFLNRTNQPTQQTGVMPHYGGGAEKCARCSKSVYLAEKKTGAGRSFHSRCFSCQTCNRKLDATTLSEHKGEIFCKTCYTRQFGVHGLVSGVSMSTEQPAREVRHSRRSSYGSDLDAPVITHEPSRQRAHSNDNMLRGEHSAIQHDELPKMFPWRNDVLPEQKLSPSPTSTTKTNFGLEHLIDKSQSPRTPSQIGFERVIGSATDNQKSELDHRQSTYTGEENRHHYILAGEKLPYGNGTSAMIDMPLVSPPKRANSQIGLIEMPSLPPRNTERSPSPSPTTPTSTNPYARQNSRERQADISDNFSRLTLNENHPNNLARQVSNGSTTKTIASENPLLKQMSSHSSTYETSHFATTSTAATHRSRDASPSDATGNQRTSSSTSGYASTSVHSDGITRNSTSPPSAYLPQHDYLNTHTSPAAQTHPVDRRPSSPRQGERTPSAVNDFVSKTSHISPATSGKYSTLAALVRPHRPASPLRYSEDDQDFDN